LALEKLRADAGGNANLLDPILACAKAGCTTGEICNTLRAVLGEYRSPADA
jgi:methylmalonyl-CoA mutase N-terminal domain/subunit